MPKKKVQRKGSSVKTVRKVSFADDTVLIILGGSALIMMIAIAILK